MQYGTVTNWISVCEREWGLWGRSAMEERKRYGKVWERKVNGKKKEKVRLNRAYRYVPQTFSKANKHPFNRWYAISDVDKFPRPISSASRFIAYCRSHITYANTKSNSFSKLFRLNMKIDVFIWLVWCIEMTPFDLFTNYAFTYTFICSSFYR